VTPDCQERERALDPTYSFIIQAPAGSGKTTLLVQRYLRLLSFVDRPESVVAMTFTRKASAEMRERIYDALSDAQNGAGEYHSDMRDLALATLQQDRKKGWNLLADPGRLQIQTIDSLCAMLTRQMPIISEFGGIGQVIEDATELYRIAARRTLRDLAAGNTEEAALFRTVALHFDDDMSALETQVTRMLEKRDQWRFLSNGEYPPVIQTFCYVLGRASERLKDVFRERGVVDFVEVTRAAIKALGTDDAPTDLLYRLDYRIEHLLVDEFQDTSLAQYELIKGLTAQWSDGDGHTLFLVGDAMQSIYRFREAEVSLFLKSWKQQRLGSVRLVALTLTTNFRSTPQIISWVQEKFSPMMSEDDDLVGAVQFRPSEASRPRGDKPQVIRFIDDKGEEEASAVVEIVRRAKEEGSVAILVRSRSHVTAILPALRNAGIPYEAVEIDRLTEQQHILDLISLTRAVLHAGDRMSWLACLRAPWCGLTLGDLSALAENKPDRTILDLLSDAENISGLSADGRMRAVRTQEILSAAMAKIGRVPLRDLIEQTWLALGGPAILVESNRREDAETYFGLIESFEEGGIVRDFSLLSQRLENLYARPSTGQDRVKIMTIHEAKGLEFDTVIIPQLGRMARGSDRDLLIWTEDIGDDGRPYLLIAAQPQRREQETDYERVSEEIKKKDAHELKRLFYVACTRARNQLYLISNVNRNKQGTALRNASETTFLGLIWESEKAEFDRELQRKIATEQTLLSLNEDAVPKTILHRLPTKWRTPHFDPSLQWQPEFRRATASARKVTYEWVSGTGRHVGTVVHQMLNRISQDGAGTWSTDRVAAVRPKIESELLRLGVPHSEHRNAVKRVIRAVSQTLTSERGRWILHGHSEAQSEWPIDGRIDENLISGTIDRTFRDEQGRLWIIDFKTSEHEGGDIESFLNEEQRRYSTQLENYGTLVARLGRGPIWLGLYFPLLDGWREWQLREAALTV
jgi:ATP-dependent helicase/nuclease subunit A